MRIFEKTSGRNAALRKGRYQCNPPGSRTNTVVKAKFFDTLEETAIFLIKNPEWKVWLEPGLGKISGGQISRGLVIEGRLDRDDLLARGIL